MSRCPCLFSWPQGTPQQAIGLGRAYPCVTKCIDVHVQSLFVKSHSVCCIKLKENSVNLCESLWAWNVNSLYPKVKMSRSQAAANRYLLVCQVCGQFVHDLGINSLRLNLRPKGAEKTEKRVALQSKKGICSNLSCWGSSRHAGLCGQDANALLRHNLKPEIKQVEYRWTSFKMV